MHQYLNLCQVMVWMECRASLPKYKPETIGQKILRFLKGLFGLGSAKPESENLYPLPDNRRTSPAGTNQTRSTDSWW